MIYMSVYESPLYFRDAVEMFPYNFANSAYSAQSQRSGREQAAGTNSVIFHRWFQEFRAKQCSDHYTVWRE